MKDQNSFTYSFRQFYDEKGNIRNLICFILLQVAVSFIFYLINYYLKDLPGSFYSNCVASSVADAIANVGCLYFLRILTVKNSFIFFFVICGISAVLVIIFEATENDNLIAIGVLGIKMGVTSAFCFVYFGLVFYFEPQYLGLAIGACNFIGRMSTIPSPIIAETEGNLPMYVTIILCGVAVLASAFLTETQTQTK